MSEARVLIVDDEEEFLEAVAERLENRGFKVSTARHGLEALDVVGKDVYDAIVLDMMLPGMDGIETLKKIRENHPNLQVILLTGHATVERGLEAIKLGAIDFLEKPADIETLTKKIQEAKAKKLLLVDQEREEAVKETLLKYGW
ncbi:MAG: response regulator [Deltaproteobacteria bacterium]|nr:response regulator [Deltaproteobacteria bacterium]